MSANKPVITALWGVVVPVVALLVWQAAADLAWINPQILPSPWAVLKKWYEYATPMATYDPTRGDYLDWLLSGELIGDTVGSLYRVLVGFAIGAGLALPLGLLMGSNRKAHALLNPLVQVLRPIPPIAYIPLSILWFGLGNPPAIFLISIGAFFPVLMNTMTGVHQVDAIYIRAARNLGIGRQAMFTHVMLPAAMPYILSGARIGMGTAFIVVIVSEMIAVNNGLGFRILEAREYFWSDKIIAGMLSIGLIGLSIDTLMTKLNTHLLRWHRSIDQ